MRVFAHTYKGHYPVGAANVIVAEDREKAIEIQQMALAQQNLPQQIKDEDFLEIDLNAEGVIILLDGEY